MSDFEKVPLEDKTAIVWTSADTFQGLVALDNWLRGFEAGGNGRVPGHFELTMHLRQLRSAEKVDTERTTGTPG